MNKELNITLQVDKNDFKKKLGIKDGVTPSKEELEAIIRPLIPEIKDGEDGVTPSKEELVSLISSIIPSFIPKDTETIIIVEKIKKSIDAISKEKGIDYNKLANLPDLELLAQKIKQASKTVSLAELDDVDLSNLTKTGGKYVFGPTTSPSASISTFEYYAQNVPSYNIIATSGSPSASPIVKTLDLGGGLRLYITITFVGGKPTTKVLSGNLPAGLTITTCTYDFSGGHTVPLKTYS